MFWKDQPEPRFLLLVNILIIKHKNKENVENIKRRLFQDSDCEFPLLVWETFEKRD